MSIGHVAYTCSIIILCAIALGCAPDKGKNQTSGEVTSSSTLVGSILVSPVDVMHDFVQRQAPSDQTVTGTNYLSNGSFENGSEGWSGCDNASILESTDAYDGDKALQVTAGHCFYQTVLVNPGEEIVLACYSKTLGRTEWTGMGLGFSDENWQIISETPATVITGGEYARYDVRATVPENSRYTTMWLYSESDAVVDNCRLTPALDAPPPPILTESNLLRNPEFDIVESGQPYDWQHFCEGSVSVKDSNGDQYAEISGGACFSQGLNASSLAAIGNHEYAYQCDIQNDGEQYATMVVNLDGTEFTTIVPSNSHSTVSVNFDGTESIASGYVGIYSEALPGSFRVYSCALEPVNTDVNTTPVDPQSNLLANASFDDLDADRKPQGWTKECTGTWGTIESSLSDAALTLQSSGHPSCVSQPLSPEIVRLLSNNTYTIECDVINETDFSGWSTLRITHGRKQHWHFLPSESNGSYSRFSATGELPELTEASFQITAVGNLTIDNCSLKAGSGASGDGLALLDIRANAEGLDVYEVNPPFSYDAVVTNIGAVPIYNIDIRNRFGGCNDAIGQLNPGETYTLECEATAELRDGQSVQPIEFFARGSYGENLNGFDDPDHVYDSDQLGYTGTAHPSHQGMLSIRAKSQTISVGDAAEFTISVAATGALSVIARVESDQSACTKQYSSPLTVGLYDVYDCVVENVTSDLTVTVESQSGIGGNNSLISDSATVSVE